MGGDWEEVVDYVTEWMGGDFEEVVDGDWEGLVGGDLRGWWVEIGRGW